MQKNKNFPWVVTPLALAISGFAAGNACASATTDTSFGVNGIASLSFDNRTSYHNYPGFHGYFIEPETITSRQPIVELDNGNIVSFASRYEETGTVSTHTYCPVGRTSSYCRTLTDGTLATSTSKTRMSRFTAGGSPLSSVDINGVIAVSALKQPDGKLVLMGNDLIRGSGTWTYDPPSTATGCYPSSPEWLCEGERTGIPVMTSQVVLKRFNADGSVDTTFDSDGTLRVGIAGGKQKAKGMVLTPDGKIVVLSTPSSGNPELWRFNSDGTVDTTFGGGDGNLSLPISNAWDLLKQQDDKLLVRYNDNNQAYARFNADGTLDSSFAGDGTLNINWPFRPNAPMLQQADGKLLFSSNNVYRYDLNGVYEQTFMIPAGAPAELFALAETAAGDVLVARGDPYNVGKVDVFYNNGVINTTVILDQSERYYANDYTTNKDSDVIGNMLLQSNGLLLASGMKSGTAALNRHINFAPAAGDADSDGITDPFDNCPAIANANQLDTDGDKTGDACDAFPSAPNPGTLNYAFNPGSGASSDVITVALQADNKIIIGGYFSAFNGTTRMNIARLNPDGSLDNSFNLVGGAYAVNSTAVQADGKIIIGGSFAGNLHYISRLNADGSLDATFNAGSGTNGAVYAVVVQADGKIIIGGSFTTFNGTARNRIARLNADGSLDATFNPGSGANAGVISTAVQADGKIIIGGYFATFNGTARNRIARLNADGSLDTSFNPGSGVNDNVRTVALQADGKVVIGGVFTTFNGAARNRIVRLNADGSLDTTFNVGIGANNDIYATVIQADGKIIIGGNFTTFNGALRNCIARLNSDGSLDAGFSQEPGAGYAIYTMAIQTYGKVIVGGSFRSYNGNERNRIARIHSGNSDGDAVEDAADKFSLNAAAAFDTDNDGHPDSWNGACDTTCQAASGLTLDRFVIDPVEWADTDNDGIGNNADTDDDNDGMPDAWELQYDFNPLVNDASGDFDGDSISNLQEYSNGTDPAIVNVISTTKNDYNNDGVAGWIWKGQSNGVETQSQIWQLTLPLQSVNYTAPARSYPPIFPEQANWDIVTSGDFNNDGDADILWRNNATAEWKVWQMQDGTRAAQNNLADFDLAHEWQVIGAGDSDKDGDDDVILNNITTGGVLIWVMHNHALAATHNVGSKGGYTLNRIGDFNKDGDVDLLFRENGSDLLVTWEIQANAFVQEWSLAQTGSGYNPVCAGDFDNDGDDDIMLINSTTEQEKWLVMENYSRTQKFGANNDGFVLLGCGDYDGDGDADSLWQRTSDDKVRAVLQQNWGVTKQTVYTNPFGGANGFVYRANTN